MAKKPKKVPVSIRLHPQDLANFKAMAAEQGLSIAELIRRTVYAQNTQRSMVFPLGADVEHRLRLYADEYLSHIPPDERARLTPEQIARTLFENELLLKTDRLL